MKLFRHVLLLPLSAGLVLAACADEPERPTTAAVAAALESSGNDPEASRCAADLLVGSDLSAESLVQIVEANTAIEEPSTSDAELAGFSFPVEPDDLVVAEALSAPLDRCLAPPV